jgi:two-component sensor histidine kinase/CheY-like chemotaxis protein
VFWPAVGDIQLGGFGAMWLRQAWRYVAKQRHLSVREWLLLIVAASSLPLLVVTCWLGYSDYMRLRGATLSELTSVSRALVQVMDRDLTARAGMLRVLAEDPSLKANDFRVFDQRARAVLDIMPAGSTIVLTDKSGQEIVNTNVPFGGRLPQASDLDSVHKVALTNNVWISDLFIGATSKRRLIGVYVPVRINTDVAYILGIGFPANELVSILNAQQLPQDSVAGILDRTGTIVARTRNPDAWVGKRATDAIEKGIGRSDEGNIEALSLDGVKVVTAWVRSPRTGWTIAIGQASATLTSALLENYVFVAIGGLLAVLSGLSIVALVGGRFIKAMSTLSDRAAAVGTGTEPPFAPSEIEEIDSVHHALTRASRLISERAKQRDSAEDQQRMLMAEIDHRVKNILANVQAIASLSLPPTPQTKSFTERLSALARVHNLLAQSRWRGTSLKMLVESTLAAYSGAVGQQVVIRGEDALLRPSTAQALSLILNELATNASKYGALSDPTGRLVVEFMHNSESTEVVIHWIEWNAKPIAAPTAKGFGSVLIDRLARELPGKVERVFHDSGLECRVSLSLSGYEAIAAPAPALPQHHAVRSLRENTRILVVEDSTLAGLELCEILTEAGFVAIGPATSVARGLAMLSENQIALAVLDVNMNGEMVFPVADALRQRKIPFVFVTGYGDDYAWPEHLRHAPQLRKPVQAFQLLDAISATILNAAINRAAE